VSEAIFNVDLGPDRDQYGRPLIEPIGGGKPIPYTRASTLAKSLSNTEGLTKWKMRMVALGVSVRPDLRALISTCWDSKRGEHLDDSIERAIEYAGGNTGSSTGTAIHALTEQYDNHGMDAIGHLEPELRRDLEAYAAATEPFKVLAMEGFVVQDELKAAGSYDRIVSGLDPWGNPGHFIADLKTGQYAAKQPHDICIQTATYAHGTHYTVGIGRQDNLADLGVNQDLSLLYHLPAGSGRCDVYWLDIRNGWHLAKVAASVRDWHSTKPIMPWSAQAMLPK
jgi:hypothetical protein